MDCDYIFVLARTDSDRPKHQGISLILVDMHQPGVRVNPIRLISGASPFNETLFENAVARADDAVGGVNNGWTAGKTPVAVRTLHPRRHQHLRFPGRAHGQEPHA